MSMFPLCHGIIPARFESSRFPGKPLAELLGKPMFWHVYDRARQCEQLQSVTLATDDERIFKAAEALNVPVVMTAADHASGTDRVLEAARKIGVGDDEVVVNIQGDEPALEPAMLTELLSPFERETTMIATLVSGMNAQEAASPDRVKAVVSQDGRALYFSRAMVPFDRDGGQGTFHLHIGVYAFRMEALARFGELPPSPLEQRERLEQLRFLENGYDIHVTETAHACHGVDRPEDLETVIRILEQK
ncbi:3-deoxy-manno-octulosonate cytidylyltransferase [Pseudodesulfovibrio senegalensis]|jgi:3-deoxy-manno-octulosonate cytidylyltransferase (CMP-KDO synthetase)|uniref:3-deoxy-manno-octulosonate cytidylyltransferase n=1 Tax=Pseudodesulfovibrio senegalensis TaxID=1721087 RepID=A0A6N6N3L2_9BACT|nr:3-deoxy-manno-octulosonate cytidylyltransferase [Pseudodesulfovibrio senegalensis]KAB1442302.1 3-deoxy-manno-octulosonate cytidylyltransferase [Pseudodesulfovibrio senegalensis]